MDFLTILLIGFGLSMDCFAVSITCGMTSNMFMLRLFMRISFFFGLFQGIMPVLGWLAGFAFRDYIQSFDHWIAFGLLLFLGLKMIREGMRNEETEKKILAAQWKVLIGLSIATSIDALSVGVTFACLGVSILYPSLVIGIVTFVVSFLGLFLGLRFGKKIRLKFDIVGGIVLIIIGLRILFSHLTA